MSLTFNNEGKAITKTIDDVQMPVDLSFDAVNEFVHSPNVQFEELQALGLVLADELEKANKKIEQIGRGLDQRFMGKG